MFNSIRRPFRCQMSAFSSTADVLKLDSVLCMHAKKGTRIRIDAFPTVKTEMNVCASRTAPRISWRGVGKLQPESKTRRQHDTFKAAIGSTVISTRMCSNESEISSKLLGELGLEFTLVLS